MAKRNRRTLKNSHTRQRKRRTRRRRRRRRTRKHRGAGWEKTVFGKRKYTNPYYTGYKTITYPFRKPRKFFRQFPGLETTIGNRRARRWEKKHSQTP